MRQIKMIIAALFLMSPFSANADPILWDVDIKLTDGGIVSGSFVFDLSTGIFSDVMVSAVGGIFPASSGSLTSVLPAFSSEVSVDFFPSDGDLTGVQDVLIVMTRSMRDAGVTIPIRYLETYTCTNADCTTFDILYSTRPNIAGSIEFTGPATITSAPVPEPGTLALLGLGLAGMGMTRRKKKV